MRTQTCYGERQPSSAVVDSSSTPASSSPEMPAQPYGAYLLWWLYCLGWSAALLTPNPGGAARALIPEDYRFLAAKVLHVSAYTTLAALTGWLGTSPRLRRLLALFLVCHAFGTEYLQRFVSTRTPSWRDVGLNCLGLFLGMALTWKWWLSRTALKCPAAGSDCVPAVPAGALSDSPAAG